VVARVWQGRAGVRIGGHALLELPEKFLERALVASHRGRGLRPRLQLRGRHVGNGGVEGAGHLVENTLDGACHEAIGVLSHRRHPA
jgi:hypothetical protein